MLTKHDITRRPTASKAGYRRKWVWNGHIVGAVLTLLTVVSSTNAAEPIGHYADVDGLHMYYEVHGEGRPILLIHGGLCTISACFGPLIDKLALTRKVIAYEFQGHGHTADIDRPLRFDLLADDASKLLQILKIQRADVLGFSDGAQVAFQLARTHPEKVSALIALSLFTTREGAYRELFTGMKNLNAETLKRTPIYDAYHQVAPKPDQFAQVCAKLSAMTAAFQDTPNEEVKALKMPLMLMYGDADMVKPEHAAALFRAAGGGVFGDMVPPPPTRLAILPGTTHFGLVARSRWVAEMVTEFLDSTASRHAK